MERFFGLMPSSEIEIERWYKDENGFKITIQAGENGWTVIYADLSTDYEDTVNKAEDNFSDAYEVAVKKIGEWGLKEIFW